MGPGRKWLGDPFLWPQVWDQNRYILDSHWIYPGDPLVGPGQARRGFPRALRSGGRPRRAKPPERRRPAETATGRRAGRRRHPYPCPRCSLADRSDLYCSGYIDAGPSSASTLSRRRERGLRSTTSPTGDVVYLNQGRNQGIAAGGEYSVVRPDALVIHPTTGAEPRHLHAAHGDVRGHAVTGRHRDRRRRDRLRGHPVPATSSSRGSRSRCPGAVAPCRVRRAAT